MKKFGKLAAALGLTATLGGCDYNFGNSDGTLNLNKGTGEVVVTNTSGERQALNLNELGQYTTQTLLNIRKAAMRTFDLDCGNLDTDKFKALSPHELNYTVNKIDEAIRASGHLEIKDDPESANHCSITQTQEGETQTETTVERHHVAFRLNDKLPTLEIRQRVSNDVMDAISINGTRFEVAPSLFRELEAEFRTNCNAQTPRFESVMSQTLIDVFAAVKDDLTPFPYLHVNELPAPSCRNLHMNGSMYGKTPGVYGRRLGIFNRSKVDNFTNELEATAAAQCNSANEALKNRKPEEKTLLPDSSFKWEMLNKNGFADSADVMKRLKDAGAPTLLISCGKSGLLTN